MNQVCQNRCTLIGIMHFELVCKTHNFDYIAPVWHFVSKTTHSNFESAKIEITFRLEKIMNRIE